MGYGSIDEAIDDEPRAMVSVSPELWTTLRALHRGGALREQFLAAWNNGSAFLRAADGLRGRVPLLVEWKGATKAPGDEVVPADLRVDHVYLVSCKYLSRIVHNVSPAAVFDRLLTGGHGLRSQDWYEVVAPDEYALLFESVRRHVPLELPSSTSALDAIARRELAKALTGRWPSELVVEARHFAEVVAVRSADRWRTAIAQSRAAERVLWRLLRIGSAPYYVLGTDKMQNLRLRIETPWDWRQAHRLIDFTVDAQASDQPVVGWRAAIEDRRSGAHTEVLGHVEVRWSHGKFNGPPEAKVYLDTPHHRVPGYVPLT